MAGALHRFGMGATEDDPQTNIVTSVEGIMAQAKAFVSDHIDLAIPDLKQFAPRTLANKCAYCDRKYEKPTMLRKHEAKVHQHIDPKYSEEPLRQEGPEPVDDHLYAHTRTIFTLGLLRLEHNDAIKMGDGQRMINVDNVLMLIYRTIKVGP